MRHFLWEMLIFCFKIWIFVFTGINFETHFYWDANYLLAWKIYCFLNPKSASSELLNAIWGTNSERNIGDFCPIFQKKNRIRNQWTWGEIQGGSINDNKTYLIFWSPLRRPCETKLPKLAEINWVKKSCPSFWRPFSNSNINIAIELAFLGFYQLYRARSKVDGQTA